MKRSVTVSVNEKKLSAIEMYLEQKNTTLAAELEKYADQLYGKVVPQNVRDFIDMMSDRKPARKQKITAPAESGKRSEQSFDTVRTVCPRVAFSEREWGNFTLKAVGANVGHFSQRFEWQKSDDFGWV